MKRRKLTAILLALALFLTLLPAAALAAVGPGWDDDCRGNPIAGGEGFGRHNWVKQSETPGKNCTS